MMNQGFRTQPIDNGDAPKRFPRTVAAPKGPSTLGRLVNALARWTGAGYRKATQPRSARGWKTIILKVLAALFILGASVLLILWFTLPNINDPATMFPSQSTVILDRNGIELYRLFSEQDRTYVHGDQINPLAKKATIAIEDARFIERSGCLDVIGFTRAALSQIAPSMFVRSGGSTLTQQFAKNALVGRQRSILRKVRELMLACQLEHHYNKDELLELYLNWIPYGLNAYGIEQASRNYFGTSAKDLTLAKSAVLAGLLQRPTYFNPYGPHRYTMVSDGAKKKINAGEITAVSQIPDAQIKIGLIGHAAGSGTTAIYVGGRTDQVLKNMLDQKMITMDDYNKALSDLKTLSFAPERQNIRAAHFVLGIQKEVEDLLGIDDRILEQGGLRITTTLDWTLQQAAEKVVTAHRDDIHKRFGANNAALVSLAPVTHQVLAYVGNSDFNDNDHEGKIDMAKAPRQPGSSFKVFTYLAAFEQGYGPGSVVYDVKTKFGEDQPENYDGTYWGLTTMRYALGGSRNIPAVKAFFLGGGEEAVLAMASRMGVTAPADQRAQLRKDTPDFSYGWPLAIGAAEVPLMQMVQGYATIADGGLFRPTSDLLKVTDKAGNLLYQPKEVPAQQVIDARLAAEITSILSDVNARPNDYWKSILSVPGVDAAAKTGTSNKCLERDTKKSCTLRRPESTWTMGFTPNLITGVWAGNATSQSLFDKADGLTTASPMWHDFMVSAQSKIKDAKTSFPVTDHLTHPLLSRLSGKLASACTPVALQQPDVALEELTPTEPDPACVLLKVDKVTGLLSSPSCPADAVEEQAFFVPRSELPDRWPLWEQGVQDWANQQMISWNARPDHSGSLLPLPLPPTKECDPLLTPGRDNKPTIELLAPTPNSMIPFPVFSPVIRIDTKAPIQQVTFSIDGKELRTFTEAPFTGILRAPHFIDQTIEHTLTATVTDQYFNTATATVSFRFGTDAKLPHVSILSPTDGSVAIVGTPLQISADATDDSGIDRVEFYLDDTLLTVKRASPYQVSYPLKATLGAHTVKVTARDSAGNEGSDAVTIKVVP